MRELSRRKPNPKNRVDLVIEAAVLAIALDQLHVSNTLKQNGIFFRPVAAFHLATAWTRDVQETFEGAGRKSRRRRPGIDRSPTTAPETGRGSARLSSSKNNQQKNGSDPATSEPLFSSTARFDILVAFPLTVLLIGGPQYGFTYFLIESYTTQVALV